MVGKTSSLTKVWFRNLKGRGISAVQTPEAWIPAETGVRGGRGMLAGRADLQQEFSTPWEERKLDMSVGRALSWNFGQHPTNSPSGVTSTSLACFSAAVIEKL